MALDREAALFWAKELTDHRVYRDELEKRKLVALLLANEMRHYGDTMHADPPASWLFAERVPSNALQRLGQMLLKNRKRSRHVLFSRCGILIIRSYV